ncbi:MAG: hypothetical protein ABI615_05690, partial [Chthoniobacterales bacterium]
RKPMRLLYLIISVLFCLNGALQAETVAERLKKDPNFELYAVIFAILQNKDGSVENVKVANILDAASDSKETAPIELPRAYFVKAEKLIRVRKHPLQTKDGKPEVFFVYYLYSPQLGDHVIDNPDASIESLKN